MKKYIVCAIRVEVSMKLKIKILIFLSFLWNIAVFIINLCTSFLVFFTLPCNLKSKQFLPPLTATSLLFSDDMFTGERVGQPVTHDITANTTTTNYFFSCLKSRLTWIYIYIYYNMITATYVSCRLLLSH